MYVCMYVCMYIRIHMHCRVVQLDYESTSALLLPNRNGIDNDGDDDEYVIYSNL